MENKKHYIFEISPFYDNDGYLSVLEENKQFPFQVKRIFYEYGMSNSSLRGAHANRKSRFCMVSISGSCDVIVNDGVHETVYKLDNPNKILYLDKMVWKTMTNFSKNCVLLVISDCCYDKDEYIRIFDKYLEELKR